jgi:hypothetical protein
MAMRAKNERYDSLMSKSDGIDACDTGYDNVDEDERQ